MSYEDYEWILNKHKEHWKPFNRNSPPAWMQVGAVGVDDKRQCLLIRLHQLIRAADVYIEPQQ